LIMTRQADHDQPLPAHLLVSLQARARQQ
jgi:hypothetical protein